MARTAITVTDLAVNTVVANPAGTTLNVGAGNGHTLSNDGLRHVALRFTNTDDDVNATVTIKASTNRASSQRSDGDLAFTLNFGTTKWIVIEEGRFGGGPILIDVTGTGAAGTVTAFRLDRLA